MGGALFVFWARREERPPAVRRREWRPRFQFNMDFPFFEEPGRFRTPLGRNCMRLGPLPKVEAFPIGATFDSSSGPWTFRPIDGYMQRLLQPRPRLACVSAWSFLQLQRMKALDYVQLVEHGGLGNCP